MGGVRLPLRAEVKGPCVYYGPPAQSCGRSSKLGEADGLLVYPARCPSK